MIEVWRRLFLSAPTAVHSALRRELKDDAHRGAGKRIKADTAGCGVAMAVDPVSGEPEN